jgi:diguanylate cyclase (GGDEF)-like protein
VRNHLELARQRKVLSALSFIDGLTGVANRRKFEEVLETEWRRCGRQDQWLGVIMVDVDFFKLFNDSYGHQAGDVCLKRIATALSENLNRGGDFIARYGGEEFVLLLPDTDIDGARATAGRLANAVNKLAMPHAKSSVAIHVTISLGGTSAAPHPDFTAEELVSFADRLLYRAKQTGRNKAIVEPFAPSRPNP